MNEPVITFFDFNSFFSFFFFKADNSSTDCAVHSTPSSKGTQPRTSAVDGLRPGLHRGTGATGEEVFDDVKEDSLQPHTGSQHNKVKLVVNCSKDTLS